MTKTKVGGYGVQTLAEWQSEYQEVLKYGKLAGLTASDTVPPLASVLDTKLVAGLYRGRWRYGSFPATYLESHQFEQHSRPNQP